MSVSIDLIKKLREKTNAGVMECKRALEEAGGNMEQALEFLRKWGIAVAQKKSSRATQEGLIASYIHPGGRIGVLVEVNCETDFVARNKDFNDFVKEISMQIAATNPKYISREDVPENVIEREKQIYLAQIADSKKDERARQKIIEGKLNKFFSEVCLMEQPYIRDESVIFKELFHSTIAKFGENIRLRRFSRFHLGEELDNKD